MTLYGSGGKKSNIHFIVTSRLVQIKRKEGTAHFPLYRYTISTQKRVNY